MNRNWLILDGDNLASRAQHTTGGLENGVMFGFFVALKTLQERFATADVAICFDCAPSKREAMDPNYKSSRKVRWEAAPPEEKAERNAARCQKHELRDLWLRRAGYRNVFAEPGYEADDLIASVAKSLPKTDSAVVVSSDKDLWQLINGRTCCHNPVTRKTVTLQDFKRDWGVSPPFWADIKAMAGCGSDDVTGIKGVGEKTAAKFLARKLKVESVAWNRITENTSVWQFNLPLVRLPFAGCPVPALRPNRVTPERWGRVCDALGLSSLRDQPPRAPGAGLTKPKLNTRYASGRR